jgi:Flp pilus assembly pilin Flp
MIRQILKDETGAATAEYAIATMAAVGFAGLLVVIMRSDEVRTILFDLVKSALSFTNPNSGAAPAN